MQERFANEVIMKLADNLPDEELNYIKRQILVTLTNYEITQKETSLVQYESYVPQFYEAYLIMLKINGRSIGTIKTYNFHLMNFFLWNKRPIIEVTVADIYKYFYYKQKENNCSNRTIDHIRIVLNAFFTWCVSNGYLFQNPCSSIKPISYIEKPREPLSDFELELVRDACRDIREKAIVEVLYSTGARVSEVINLKLKDIDLNKKQVTLLGKGNKYRTTFINARAELLLHKYFETRSDECDSLFVTSRQPIRPMTKTNLEKIIRDIGERAQLDKPLTPHIFRHTFATNLLKRGAKLEDVQKLLGHTKPSTTLIYAKIDNSTIKIDHEKYII